MLFSRDKNENKKQDGQTLMGFLFKPDIAGSIRPIGESAAMFVQLLALIFVSGGLFPKNHPALQGDRSVRLTMGEVIRTAYANLTFSRENLPQILLFVGVVGSLAIMGLVVFFFLLSLFVGTAHAQNMFSAPNPNADLAHQWLIYLFKGDAMNIPGITDANNQVISVPQPTNIQTALKAGLAYYSTAILVIAGFILLYHLLHMIAETAHTGKVMGNANQIWAPIRLVVAIGLLIPVSSTSMNVGQHIAIKMADWGSALASNTWKTFLTSVANQGTNFVVPPVPRVADTIRDVARMYACMRVYNFYLTQISPAVDKTQLGTYIIYKELAQTDAQYKYEFGNLLTNRRRVCGAYEFMTVVPSGSGLSESDQEIRKKIYAAGRTALLGTESQIAAFVESYFGPTLGDNSVKTVEANDAALKAVIQAYQSNLKGALTSAFGSKTDIAVSNLAAKWSDLGWVTAGAWFNTIARTQGNIVDAVHDSMPKRSLPNLTVSADGDNRLEGIEVEAFAALNRFEGWLNSGYSQGYSYTEADLKDMGSDASLYVKHQDSSGVLTLISETMKKTLGDNKLFEPRSTMIGKTANPLAELAEIGHRNIIAAFGTLDVMLYALAGTDLGTRLAANSSRLKFVGAGFKFMGDVAKEVKDFMTPILLIYCTVLFTTGVMLGFVIPLLPFTLFFFNVLAWILSIFESVVSMPLFALAHLTTKGEGLPGDMARQGYFFLLAIFLRPVLMIFGLIAGLLIFYVAISFLNMTFSIAQSGSEAYSGSGFQQLSNIIFNIFYSIFAYICANTSFKAIGFFAEHGMKWMNASGPAIEKMGDKQLFGTVMQTVTTVGAHQVMGAMLQNPIGAAGTLNVLGRMGGGGGGGGAHKPMSEAVKPLAESMLDDGPPAVSGPSGGSAVAGESGNASLLPGVMAGGQTTGANQQGNKENSTQLPVSAKDKPAALGGSKPLAGAAQAGDVGKKKSDTFTPPDPDTMSS